MNIFDFVALVLAAGAVVDAWFNGSIFAEMRALAELQANSSTALYTEEQTPPPPGDELPVPDDPLPGWMRIASKIVPIWAADLLTCPFCLSYHVPIWLAGIFILPSFFLPAPWSILLKLPIYCLAATRASNILNGVLPASLQYTSELAGQYDYRTTDSGDNTPGIVEEDIQ